MLTTIMIGNKIAEARKKISISQAQLAERLFISSQAVGKWERGESMPDIITFNHLAEVLGVDLNYFSESVQSSASGSDNPRVTSAESFIKQLDEPSSGNTKKKLNWDMSRGNWLGADFSGLKNLHEKFSASNMQRCKFIGSDLSGLLLQGNNVNSCDFTGSDIRSSHIQSSNLLNNLFKECLLNETEFSESYIMGCDFSGADFTGTVFKSGGFQNNLAVNAVWNRTSFNTMQIVDSVFSGTVEDCSFENCSFKKVTFQDSKLINTFFKNRNLKGVGFIDCRADRMTYEFLKNGKADLTGITLLS
jgi:transcriptional regulator with XRE-family HTH domain